MSIQQFMLTFFPLFIQKIQEETGQCVYVCGGGKGFRTSKGGGEINERAHLID